MLGYKKGNTKLLAGQISLHYPADRVYLDGDTTKNVQDKVARKKDLTNLDLTGTTNTTGSTIASGTFFYLNGTLVRAKTDIANGATFTLNTNYEIPADGGLNQIKTKEIDISGISLNYSENGWRQAIYPAIAGVNQILNIGWFAGYIGSVVFAPYRTDQFLITSPTISTLPSNVKVKIYYI